MEYYEDELVVCINFDDKIDQNFFKKPNIFFNAVNLDSQRPLIQIDRHIFKGSYEDCLGTNIFLQEISEPRSVDKVFQTAAPMHLEHLNTSTKILNLKWINVPQEIKTLNESEISDVSFLEDYQSVLDKIENGALDIQDAITGLRVENTNSGTIEVLQVSLQDSAEVSKEEKIKTTEARKEAVINQDLLRSLFKPSISKEDYAAEVLQENLFDIEACEDFAIVKQLFMNHLTNKTICLNDLTINLADANIYNLVNVEKSIQEGVIAKPEFDNLSDDDKQSLFSIRNFDNISLPVKFVILTEYLNDCKKQFQKFSEQELMANDNLNRTLRARYKLLKSLARDIEYVLLKHLTMEVEKEI